MPRPAPIYTYIAGDGRTLPFGLDDTADYIATDVAGEDCIDVDISAAAANGQPGTQVTGMAVGARTITVTGAIVRDQSANDRRLRALLRPHAAGRWCKTVEGKTWYMDVVTKTSPAISGGPHLLRFQFSLYAAYPYWRTLDTSTTVLGGLEPAWFPTPVSTAGSWAISRYKQSLYTTVVNAGDMPTGFVLELRASALVQRPMLWHNGLRTYILLNANMTAGERVVISTLDDSRGCTWFTSQGVSQNAFRHLDPDSDLWMTLQPGENVLRLTADDGRSNLHAAIIAPKGVTNSV